MQSKNTKKGIMFGVIGTFLIGLQPIFANSRPMILDPYFFAATTTMVQAIVFIPFVMLERNRLKALRIRMINNNENIEIVNSQINGWKNKKLVLLFVGFIFGVGNILFYAGYELSGAINGSLAQKSTVLFGLIYGYIFLKDRITKVQILFSCLLLIGLILAVTHGSFNLLEFNIGVLIILILTAIWMFGHTITKKSIFISSSSTPTQLVFIRNWISGLILFSTYFLFFPIENFHLFSDPVNLFSICSMGIVYSAGLWCWYKTLSYVDVSVATILTSPTPIATAFFATIILNETFTLYHLLGMIIVIGSIIMIVREEKEVVEVR